MLCPQCQLPLIVSKLQSEEVNKCPKCQGIWLKYDSLENIVGQIQPIENLEQYRRTNNQAKQNKENTLNKKTQTTRNTGKKHPHFLSGSLDIYDDW